MPLTHIGRQAGAQAGRQARTAAAFTLDACRHGGMTELEEGGNLRPGREGCYPGIERIGPIAVMPRRLWNGLWRQRASGAHRLANENGTSVQNDRQIAVQNEAIHGDKAIA